MSSRSRRRTAGASLVACALAILQACSVRVGRDSPAAARLRQLSDEVWQQALEEDIFLRLREGLPIDRLPEVSYRDAVEDADFARSVLERLEDIDPGDLSDEDVLTYEILEWESRMQVEGLPYLFHRSVLTPYSSPLPRLRLIFESYRFQHPADLQGYLRLLQQVPSLVGEIQERAAEQLARGIVVPRPNMPAVIGIVRSAIQPAEQGVFAVGDERLKGLDLEPQRIEDFRARLARIVEEDVNPALQRLAAFLEGEYGARAPEQVGLSQYAGGDAAYRYLVRLHTTVDITPEEVQRIGFEMVAEIEAAMDAVREEVGFEGGREEFRRHLRTDSRYFPGSPNEVADRLLAAAEAMMQRIDRFFLGLPGAPYDVQRLDPALEGAQTYGYYERPTATDPVGTYYYNGSRLDQRSWLPLRALALHELVPGHHFQIARQYENEGLPAFRRHGLHTAYTEGWGAYSSFLGLEAGVYDDPYSRYGLYMLEVFLASRLVVDPGMNSLGWSLEQARNYMREHTLESGTQIATETLRYSTDMPGQALGYQIGKRKLLELRRRAEEAFGDRFDLRRFHEAVLGAGSMPLTVLERHIARYIDRELAAAGAVGSPRIHPATVSSPTPSARLQRRGSPQAVIIPVVGSIQIPWKEPWCQFHGFTTSNGTPPAATRSRTASSASASIMVWPGRV